MPAVSKDQQRAAAIALKAKRDGKVDDLPKNSASYSMAKSMTEKELDKLASTKRKGLPKEKNESAKWAGSSLVEVFKEEMLDTDGEGEAITSDKNVNDQNEDADRDEDNTGWDEYDDTWTAKVTNSPTQAGAPLATNTGSARVSEAKDPNSLDILFEQSRGEYYMADEYYDLTHSPEDDWADERNAARADYEAEMASQKEDQIIGDMVDHLLFHKDKHGTPIDEWEPEDLVMDFTYDYAIDSEDPEDLAIAERAIEQAKAQSGDVTEGIYESAQQARRWQKMAGVIVEKEEKKWMQKAVNPKEKGELHRKLGIPEDENIPMETLEAKKKELQKKAEGDKKLTDAERELLGQVQFAINAKKANEAAGRATSKPLKEMSQAQLVRYVKRLAKHGWEWEKVAAQLRDQYGVGLRDIEGLESDYREALDEHMLGGVSNGAPNPGWRAQMNENSDLEWLEQDKPHRVDMWSARDELAAMAYEIGGQIQGMHLDDSDRMTEKMTKNKLGNMYKFLKKLKKLTN